MKTYDLLAGEVKKMRICLGGHVPNLLIEVRTCAYIWSQKCQIEMNKGSSYTHRNQCVYAYYIYIYIYHISILCMHMHMHMHMHNMYCRNATKDILHGAAIGSLSPRT